MSEYNLTELKAKPITPFLITFLLFFITLLLDFLGLEKVGRYIFYVCFISGFITFYYSVRYVYYGHVEGFKNLKDGKPFFSGELSNDPIIPVKKKPEQETNSQNEPKDKP